MDRRVWEGRKRKDPSWDFLHSQTVRGRATAAKSFVEIIERNFDQHW